VGLLAVGWVACRVWFAEGQRVAVRLRLVTPACALLFAGPSPPRHTHARKCRGSESVSVPSISKSSPLRVVRSGRGRGAGAAAPPVALMATAAPRPPVAAPGLTAAGVWLVTRTVDG